MIELVKEFSENAKLVIEEAISISSKYSTAQVFNMRIRKLYENINEFVETYVFDGMDDSLVIDYLEEFEDIVLYCRDRYGKGTYPYRVMNSLADIIEEVFDEYYRLTK